MYNIYIVNGEDSLDNIAKKFNVNIEDIYKINNFPPLKEISVGEKIIIPLKKSSEFNYYEIKKGDTLYNIAQRFKISPIDLALINGLDLNDYIYDKQIILVPKENYIFTISSNGDTLKEIADRLNVPIEDLLNQNENIYILPEQLIIYENKVNN